MKNSKPFVFKQFEIQQNHSGFKVGTDGCLLGAWAELNEADSILDVGTGSGLIALMAAQRNPKATITAIEIETGSFEQAKSNFESSKWNDRINVVNQSLQSFARSTQSRFDHILCNPPFFSKSTQNQEASQTRARHDDDLPLSDLIALSMELMTENGKLSLVYPFDRETELIEIAQLNGLYITRICRIRPFPEKETNRILCTFQKPLSIKLKEEEMSLYDTINVYGEQSKKLFSPFYLKL